MKPPSAAFARMMADDRKAERRLFWSEVAVLAFVIALAAWRLHAGA